MLLPILHSIFTSSSDLQVYFQHYVFFFRLNRIISSIYNLALQNFTSTSIVSSCVTFLELLGVESVRVRVDGRVARLICEYWNHRAENEKKYTLERLKEVLGE